MYFHVAGVGCDAVEGCDACDGVELQGEICDGIESEGEAAAAGLLNINMNINIHSNSNIHIDIHINIIINRPAAAAEAEAAAQYPDPTGSAKGSVCQDHRELAADRPQHVAVHVEQHQPDERFKVVEDHRVPCTIVDPGPASIVIPTPIIAAAIAASILILICNTNT